MSQIKKTTDYFMFKKHPSNRDIDQGNLNRLKNSLKVKNLMMFRPILVDKDMQILDGQHRLEAAKQIGIDVYYQIQEDSTDEEIILINANQRKWGREDYLKYYVSKGNIHYIKAAQYMDKNNMNLAEFLRITPNFSYGGSGGSRAGRPRDNFVTGSYKFPDAEQLESMEKITANYKKVLGSIERLLVNKPNFLKSTLFKKSMVSFLNIIDVDVEVFISKLIFKVESLRPCAEISAYLSLFTSIYNWRNKYPIGEHTNES